VAVFHVDLTVAGAAAPSELSADLGSVEALTDPWPTQQSRPELEFFIISKAPCVVRD